MSDGGMIPADAQGLAVVVLLYTLANAVVAGLVVLMHCRHGDPLGCKGPCSVVAKDLTYANAHLHRRPALCLLHDCQHYGLFHSADTFLHQL
jgi:hypothetical protein